MELIQLGALEEIPLPDAVGEDVVEVPGKPFKFYSFGDHIGRDGRPVRVTEKQAKAILTDAHSLLNDLPILFEHGKAHEGQAAGWFDPKTVAVHDDAIWIEKPRWTQLGYGEIKKKLRRFVSGSAWGSKSADGFHLPERLREVTITNVANLADLPPITASSDDMKGADMELKEFAVALGLPETATKEEVLDGLRKEKEASAKAVKDAADAKAALENASKPPEKKPEDKPLNVEELTSQIKTDLRHEQEVETFVSKLVSDGKLTTKEEREAALKSAKADFPTFKALSVNFPVKSPTRKVISGVSSDEGAARHASDHIGTAFNGDADQMAKHNRVLAFITAQKAGGRVVTYTQALLELR